MKSYVIRFKRKGQEQVEQLEIEGDFTIWRADAGFMNENIMDVPLRKFEAGPQSAYADEESITAVVCVEPKDT